MERETSFPGQELVREIKINSIPTNGIAVIGDVHLAEYSVEALNLPFVRRMVNFLVRELVIKRVPYLAAFNGLYHSPLWPSLRNRFPKVNYKWSSVRTEIIDPLENLAGVNTLVLAGDIMDDSIVPDVDALIRISSPFFDRLESMLEKGEFQRVILLQGNHESIKLLKAIEQRYQFLEVGEEVVVEDGERKIRIAHGHKVARAPIGEDMLKEAQAESVSGGILKGIMMKLAGKISLKGFPAFVGNIILGPRLRYARIPNFIKRKLVTSIDPMREYALSLGEVVVLCHAHVVVYEPENGFFSPGSWGMNGDDRNAVVLKPGGIEMRRC